MVVTHPCAQCSFGAKIVLEAAVNSSRSHILTCAANSMMAPIHDRMPVILHPSDYQRWLSEEPDPADLLKPFPADLMTMWPINPIKSKGPEVLEPLPAEDDEEPTLF